MKKRTRIAIGLLSLMMVFFMGSAVFAQKVEEKAQDRLGNYSVELGLRAPSISQLSAFIIDSLLAIVGSLFLVMIVYAGFIWQTAQGNEEKAKKAFQIIFSSIIGLVIVVGAYVFIHGLLGGLIGIISGS